MFIFQGFFGISLSNNEISDYVQSDERMYVFVDCYLAWWCLGEADGRGDGAMVVMVVNDNGYNCGSANDW